MVGYKRKSDGRVIVPYPYPNNYSYYIAATPTDKTIKHPGYYSTQLDSYINKETMTFVTIEDLTWLHPHLLKCTKQQLKIKK